MYTPPPVRRKDRALSPSESLAILKAGEYGVLATNGPEGRPLATPLSYIMLDGYLYFHCAGTGHKLNNLAACPEVCFSVVGNTQPVFLSNFTTLYESVTLHGTAHIVEDSDEKQRVLLALCEKYLPAHMDKAPEMVKNSLDATTVVRIIPQAITGKARRQ